MLCNACSGTGESRSYYAGEGICRTCKGSGEVMVECKDCGEMFEDVDDWGRCEECAKLMVEELA